MQPEYAILRQPNHNGSNDTDSDGNRSTNRYDAYIGDGNPAAGGDSYHGCSGDTGANRHPCQRFPNRAGRYGATGPHTHRQPAGHLDWVAA